MKRKGSNIFSLVQNKISDKKHAARLKHLLGFNPSWRHAGLYNQAFRHASASGKSKDISVNISNERLEFLGDAILDAVVADLLFKKFALKGEGFLTEMRSKIVSRDQLNNLAERIGLVEFLEIDRSLEMQFHVRKALAGNALESLIGAIYLDKGYDKTRKFIMAKLIKPYLDLGELENVNENFKSILYQYVQRKKSTVAFELAGEKGKSHQKSFSIAVIIDGEEVARATQFTKKKAEQMAARKACEVLKLLPE